MKLHKAVSFLGILWVGVAGLAAADTPDTLTDDATRVAIEAKLDDANIVNGGGPRVDVREGVVTLTGSVKSLWAKTKAIELAMELDDVVVVEDQLEIAAAESDDALVEAVSKTVLRYPHFTIYDDVNVAIDDGNVVLTGRVTMPFKSDEIESRISRVMGVQSLTNEIKTLPTNIGDEQIRANLTYRIYSDALFQRYAFRANPPIHIIVERGNVALTGAVGTEVERRKAEVIARQTFGVFDVDNRLTVGD
jgi:osmotically-inducible protein OsmY